MSERALVVGYDGSDCARAAFEAAVDLARSTGDRLIVAFGYEPPVGYGEEIKAHREIVRKHGERVTAEAMDRAAELGVAAELALVPSHPTEALEALAEEHDARAIVVGSYGESPLKSAILGSTPHRLLHEAARPVLVVPVPSGR
jgi:nucleotide-binding universal stress UspA family protein